MTSTQAPAKADGPKSPKSPRSAKAAAKPAKAAKAPPPTKADEILDALRAASRDKEIELDRLVAALEEAIATAARKVYKVREMAARFDPKTGELIAWTPYRVVEQKTKPEAPEEQKPVDPDDVPLGQVVTTAPGSGAFGADADKEIRLPWIEILPEEVGPLLAGELAGQSWRIVRESGGLESEVSAAVIEVGDEIRLYRSTEGLGRIAAQSAKQVLYQKVREAERDNIYNEYVPKVGELITGTVKRFERGDMIVDLGRCEAVIPREHQSRAERYTQGERVRGVLYEVHKNPKGAQIVLSRTAPELLMRLMEMEVPEIYDGTVIIKGCVRQPGDRAKVAVFSRERDVDPVGACVGMRGARVQAIMRELRGERIDIIQFSDDLITYAQNALSPAKITRVSAMPGEAEELDADGQPVEMPTLECIVEEDQLSLAIGKRGQNVRLAAALIGARIEIKSEQAVKAEVAQAFQRLLQQSQRRQTPLGDLPGLGEGVADALQSAGFGTVGDLLDAAQAEEDGDAEALKGVTLTNEALEDAIETAQIFDSAPYADEEDEDADEEEEGLDDEEPPEDGEDGGGSGETAESPARGAAGTEEAPVGAAEPLQATADKETQEK